MEEVWKDMNLASLNDQNRRPITNRSNFGGVMFQEFLSRPIIDPPNNCSILSSSSETASLYSSGPSSAPLLTALSLSSRPDLYLHFDPLTPKHASTPSPLHTFHSSLGTKRFAEPSPDCSLGDRRNKRMIKNRESAARSRARKQAYTNELELKVQLLKEENARLRRQQQQLSEAGASQEKKKNTLYRTSTAPF